jgi:serine/threonine protein kinase
MMNPDEDDVSDDIKDKEEVVSKDEETWGFTKEDQTLTSSKAIAVVDHVKESLLKKRLSEAGSDFDIKFEKSLARFCNSEIILDKIIGCGSFSEIYTIQTFQPSESFKGCSEEQFYAAEQVKETYKPNEVVIKVLRGKLLLNPALFAAGVADLVTEATILSAVSHPNIVSIKGRSVASVEAFTSGRRDSFFILLERLHGTLSDALNNWRKRASENGVIRRGLKGMHNFRTGLLLERIIIMTQLADGMTYIHERCIIHRDLKISNVGIDSAGRVKLFDFGLAKILPKSTSGKEIFLLTKNTGSIRYMAPEIGRGDHYNLVRNLLFEMLNGRSRHPYISMFY